MSFTNEIIDVNQKIAQEFTKNYISQFGLSLNTHNYCGSKWCSICNNQKNQSINSGLNTQHLQYQGNANMYCGDIVQTRTVL